MKTVNLNIRSLIDNLIVVGDISPAQEVELHKKLVRILERAADDAQIAINESSGTGKTTPDTGSAKKPELARQLRAKMIELEIIVNEAMAAGMLVDLHCYTGKTGCSNDHERFIASKVATEERIIY